MRTAGPAGVALHYRGDEAVPVASVGLDQARLLRAVGDCCPNLPERGGERCLGHYCARPHRLEELVLLHDAIAVTDQVEQQLKGFGSKRNGLPRTPQLEARFIKLEFRVVAQYKDCAAATNFLKDARLWVDGFSGFTTQELELLAEMLVVASDSYIALCLDPAELDPDTYAASG